MVTLSQNIKENSRHVAEFAGKSLELYSISFLQDIKNGVSNSYFVKIKTFRLPTSKLSGNRRKMYIVDVICNRFYFRENQEDVLGHGSGQGISASKKNVYLFISGLFQKKNKQGG